MNKSRRTFLGICLSLPFGFLFKKEEQEWKEISRAEVYTCRPTYPLTKCRLMSDYDICTKWLKCTDVEAKDLIARLRKEKLKGI